ncbi:MAG: hypothetical protein M3041_16170, partial [Acidobacteriota bacterium]|nr:hypothetical protein [Acidobacteriota bacterium]
MNARVFVLMTAVVALTAATLFATSAGWNGRILFRDGGAVASINPDGTGLRIIARPPAGCQCSYEDPAGASDGRIALMRGTPAGGSELIVMNADGTNIKVLTTGVHGTVRKPAWSPDGTKIAFEDQGIFGFPADVDIINADGTGFTNLFTTGHAFYEPAWSPDGKKLAMSVNDLGPGSGEHIDIVNADGTGLSALTTGKGDHSPTWSPDGTQIAFGAGPEIYRIKTDGTGLTNLTNGADTDVHPSWSPDGTRITFQTQRSGFDAWTMSAVDGSGRFPLTNCDCANSPSWTPWIDTTTNVPIQGNGVTVTFSNVTTPGITSMTRLASCPTTPSGFQLGACYE